MVMVIFRIGHKAGKMILSRVFFASLFHDCLAKVVSTTPFFAILGKYCCFAAFRFGYKAKSADRYAEKGGACDYRTASELKKRSGHLILRVEPCYSMSGRFLV